MTFTKTKDENLGLGESCKARMVRTRKRFIPEMRARLETAYKYYGNPDLFVPFMERLNELNAELELYAEETDALYARVGGKNRT